MYGCECWTIKKAEHWSIDGFELWCWRRLLRVPWTTGRSDQSILKEISPGYSLEGNWCWSWNSNTLATWGKELTLWDPMDYSTPGFSVLHYLPKFSQTHVHWVGDAIQPSHPLSPPSPSVLNLYQHQSLFQWVGSLHQVAIGLEFQLQHQSFQWIFRADFL